MKELSRTAEGRRELLQAGVPKFNIASDLPRSLPSPTLPLTLLFNCSTPMIAAAEAPRGLQQALQQGNLQPETAVQAKRIMKWLQKRSSD